MGRNKMNFIDLCRGEFGRKIAYTGVSQITTANVRKVISDTIGTHNRNRVLIDYLYRYYKGDQPILYREKWCDRKLTTVYARTMHWKLSASKHHRHMANYPVCVQEEKSYRRSK